ncbi:flagellar L-ring protein FlgH [Skermanella stibiiresistens SB22]|jgi:flagellar L-ring protein precursor FlgH|uniref:Flagellar L-ring protein n=1 Tax=Skermanella stibiiresistens SB22 TaxID=1385369 RepID=W9GXK1_9PROT|nr:flagellar basal body L-ring protein FlgH [Skermanella stibiiresistens]EWY37167.1 flagellar L-ring protein FlgH [Skermanella stibiiresistens SB22]
MSLARIALIAAAAASLSACNAASRLADVGGTPALTQIENPNRVPGYVPVSLPMPAPQTGVREANSLWRSGARAFFKDQRASRVGDILTVTININDQAQLNNQTTRTRANSENAGMPEVFGFDLNKILPGTSAAKALLEGKLDGNSTQYEPGGRDSLLGLTSDTSNKGTGQINRKETITLQVAALITDVLPNGNLVLQGRQEVRVNFEVRELLLSGVIRPEDINSANSISYEKIAEARISYGGRGQITDVQQPRYGQQIFDIIMPF